jgi:hypothetical protein
MATMIPSVMQDDNDSFGEREVFNALKTKLGKDYTVFHSVRWNDIYQSKRTVWGESDFTIFHPQKGIIVIEVKSGGVEYKDGKWSYVRTDTGERFPMKNPLKQADKSKYKFIDLIDDLFEDKGYSGKIRCQIEPAVWFPSVSSLTEVGNLPIDYHKEIVLLEDALEDPETYINRIYEFYSMKDLTYLIPESAKAIIDEFAPHFRAVASLRSKREEQKEMFFRLTEEQNSLINYLEVQKTAAIQGAAGTGKTVLACEKAKSLAKDGKVLFLCYNQFLRKALQEEKELNPEKYQNVDFYNIHQLVSTKIRSANVDDDDIEAFLNNYDEYDWDYKHIIIDEAQDFKDSFIESLYLIASETGGAFYVFFDKNQFVQGREFPDWLRDAECRLILNINCRNTYRIAEASGRPIGIEPRMLKSVKGDHANLYICKDRRSVEKKVLQLINRYYENKYPLDEICLITTKTVERSILAGITKIGPFEVTDERQRGKILFTTSRKFKGLESDAIILVDIDEETFSNDENARLFYVGSSRAKMNLDLIVNGDETTIGTIVDQLDLKPRSKPIAAFVKALDLKYQPDNE